jgi:hypothetical protein
MSRLIAQALLDEPGGWTPSARLVKRPVDVLDLPIYRPILVEHSHSLTHAAPDALPVDETDGFGSGRPKQHPRWPFRTWRPLDITQIPSALKAAQAGPYHYGQQVSVRQLLYKP